MAACIATGCVFLQWNKSCQYNASSLDESKWVSARAAVPAPKFSFLSLNFFNYLKNASPEHLKTKYLTFHFLNELMLIMQDFLNL